MGFFTEGCHPYFFEASERVLACEKKLEEPLSCDHEEPTHASNVWNVSPDNISSGESDSGIATRTLMRARGVVPGEIAATATVRPPHAQPCQTDVS